MTMNDVVVPLPVSDDEATQTNDWELASQFVRMWRYLKWSFTALIVISFLLVIGQGFMFYRIFSDVHPLLGLAFIAALSLILLVLVGRPLAGFFRTPVMATPPDVHVDPSNPSPAAMKERLQYDLKYLKAMRRNPELTLERPLMDADIKVGQGLLARCGAAKGEDAKALAQDIANFETKHIEVRLRALDARIDRLIHAEAVSVGVATAISMNGTIDAFIVLWRNANLVSRIARVYFGRPNLRGSLLILRDVAAIVVLSRAVEDVTEMTGEIVGGLLGRMGGLVAGPVMDGGINAMMTLKLGYLAKRRCRSFEAWTPERSGSIAEEALKRVKAESGSVIAELLKRSGGLTSTAAKAAERAMDGSKNAWAQVQSWFGRKPPLSEPHS